MITPLRMNDGTLLVVRGFVTGSSASVIAPPPDQSNPAGGVPELQHLAYVMQWLLFAALAAAAPEEAGATKLADRNGRIGH